MLDPLVRRQGDATVEQDEEGEDSVMEGVGDSAVGGGEQGERKVSRGVLGTRSMSEGKATRR